LNVLLLHEDGGALQDEVTKHFSEDCNDNKLKIIGPFSAFYLKEF